MGIGYIGGRELSKRTAREFLAAMGLNVGAGLALRELARASVKFFFPGGGNVISAGIAFTATWGIGEASVAYFIDNMSLSEAKAAMKRGRKRHEKEAEVLAASLKKDSAESH